ncbi:lysis system o-spanin lipoprotein Rz1 [Yersinia enterocolitica]
MCPPPVPKPAPPAWMMLPPPDLLTPLSGIINTETQEISQCARKMARWGVGGRKQILLTARKRMIDEIQMYLPGLGSHAGNYCDIQ